jgi:hypothetical protein
VRQTGDDVLADAVGEVFLLQITAYIGERQDSDGRPIGKSRIARILRNSDRGLNARLDAIDMGRAGNVLDVVLARIDEADGQLLADMLAHRGADADPARLGQPLQPRRNVDTVAEDVALVDDHVAYVDADTEADAPALLDAGVAHALLDHDRAAHRIDDRGELDQKFHRPWS